MLVQIIEQNIQPDLNADHRIIFIKIESGV